MPIFAIFKTFKFWVVVVAIVAVIALIYAYGKSKEDQGAMKITNKVNSATIDSLKKNVAKGNDAQEAAHRDQEKNKSDNQQFDTNQAAVETGIKKKYIQKVTVKNNQNQTVVIEQDLPATVPNAEEQEISDSRIDDSWTRYCHYQELEGTPCAKH